MSIKRKLNIFCLLCLGFALLLAAFDPHKSELRYLAQALMAHTGTDSSRFMDQAWSTVQAGKPLYQTLFFDQHVKFIYPPSSLLTYAAMQALHLPAALTLKIAILISLPLVLVAAGEVFLQVWPVPEYKTPHTLFFRLRIALLGLLFYPLIYGVCLGQIQTVLTLLWTVAVMFWFGGQKVLSGICIALICAFKPTLAVFLIWALLRKEWKFLLSIVGATTIIQLIAIARFGWHDEVDYLAVLGYMSHRGEAFIPNQTVNGLLQRLLHNGNMTVWSDFSYPPFNHTVYFGTLLSSAALLFFGLVFPLFRSWKATPVDFMLFGVISTVASPIAWEHHYGYFFVPCIFLLAIYLQRKSRSIPFFLICFLVLSNPWSWLTRLAATPLNPLLSYDLFAGLGIILLLAFVSEPPTVSGTSLEDRSFMLEKQREPLTPSVADGSAA